MLNLWLINALGCILHLIYSLAPASYCACERDKQHTTGAKDLSIFRTNWSLLNKFLKHFDSCFSRKQFAMFSLLIYALFKDYKRNSLEAMMKATYTDYQKLQYFLSDSNLLCKTRWARDPHQRHSWDKIKYVKYQSPDGSETSHKTYSFEAKLKDSKVPIRFVAIFGKWNKDATVHIRIINQFKTSAKTILTNYLLRWRIEHCFKEWKDAFSFDHYQIWHIRKIERYWNLCLIAWTLTYWIKQNALRKICRMIFNKVMYLLGFEQQCLIRPYDV